MPKIHFRPYNPNQTVLFPQRIDEDIAENDPVRMVDALVKSLNLESFRKLYKESGRSPYHPRMMLKVILYAYMNGHASIAGVAEGFQCARPRPGAEQLQCVGRRVEGTQPA